jgi:hypothetical protein
MSVGGGGLRCVNFAAGYLFPKYNPFSINSSGGPIVPNHVHYAEEDGGKREFVCIGV